MLSSDLEKILIEEQRRLPSILTPELEQLKGKQFWLWNSFQHKSMHGKKESLIKRECCFNHMIGLPKKNGIEMPMFDYEGILYNCLMVDSYQNGTSTSNVLLLYPHKVKHLACLKSSGLGLTEFFLRFMVWLCVKDDKLKGTDMLIITAPRINLAIDLINRIKKLFYDKLKVTFDSKETTVVINNVRIHAIPSHNISAGRGIPSVSFVFVDEASFIPDGQKQEVLDVIERYAGKSNAYIVLLSTPNKPGDILDTILQQPYPESFYKVCKFNYEWGVGKIYTAEDIRIAKASSSFEREYNNAFVGQEGDVFNSKDIDSAIILGDKIGYSVNHHCRHIMGLDPSIGGNSSYAIVVLQYDAVNHKRIQVTHAEQYSRGQWDYNQMIDRIMEISRECGILNNIYVDAANPNVVESLKGEFRENNNWTYIKERFAEDKKFNRRIEEQMKVIPTPFGTEAVRMLVNTKQLLETPDLIAIHSKFTNLIISLRSARAENYHLQKDESVNNDLLDAFRLALQYFKLTKE